MAWIRKISIKKILIGLAVFFFVFTIFGFFILPPILKSVVVNKLAEALHREVTIEQIKINPYVLSATVRGLHVKDRERADTFFSCDELFLNLQSLSSLKRALILKEIRLTRPTIKMARRQDLSYNFSDLMEKKEEPQPVKKSTPLHFSLNNIRIQNGSIDFDDEPKKTKHTVRELNVGLPFISNIPSDIQTFVQPSFSARINDAPYSFQGKTKPFTDSRETEFDILINDLDLPYYLAYAPMKMNMKIRSAFLDVKTKLVFIQYKDKKQPAITVTGDVSLKKIAVEDQQNQSLIQLPRLDLSIASAEPMTKTFHLSKISIQSPELGIRRLQTGDLNILTLFPEEKKQAPPSKKEEVSEPLSIDIDEIEMTGGKITFSDLSTKKPFKTILDPVALKIDHFSNGKDKKSAYLLSFQTEAKENIKLEGDLSLNPLAVEGGLELKTIPLKKYAPYYQEQILFDIEDGRLNLSTRYRYRKGEKELEILLSLSSLYLSNLRFKKTEEGDDFLKIPAFSIKDTEVDLTKKELKIGSLFSQKGDVHLIRKKDGEINVLKLVPSSSTPKDPPPEAKTKEAEKPWLVSLKQLGIDQYKMTVEDQVPPEPVALTIEDFKLRGESLSTAKNSKGKISLSLLLDQKGTLSTAGTIGLDPLLADLKLDLKDIGIGLFQSYFTDKINLKVTSGTFSTAGNLSIETTENKELRTVYRGETALSNFTSIDKGSGDDFLKWGSLAFNEMQVGTQPLLVDMKGISLSDFYAEIAIDAKGGLNLQEIIKKTAPEKETPPPSPTQPGQASVKTAESPIEKEPTKNIKIGSITLQGGVINFIDRSLQPHYSLKLSEMGGRISGLSSEETTRADVELRAKLNDYAPLEITGKINPLQENLYVDLKARFKDMDLGGVTPYSGKFAGYTIQKGKLSFDLTYLIDKRKLDSKNRIFFDQLTLGDKVESPKATKLPVKLAIALLKDRKGEIHLDIPVAGSLDDPKFSVFKIILQVITNLIAKAATSPFSLLGAAFGGGEELSYLEFDYGSTTLAEPSMKKIDTLAKALRDRPSLKMAIEGHVDVEKDKEGLKQYLFQRKLKTQKLNELVKKGSPSLPVDEVKIESTEYEKYLKKAYKEEKFPKAKNVIGLPKDLPVPEMEKLILAHIEPKDEDLRTLATQRAIKTKDAILKSGQIEPERIFIIQPKSLTPEKKQKIKESRVDFKIS
jgi:hypothetical protein